MGIRETYFGDLIRDYEDRKEKSFLYRTFWAENVKDLLKKYLPPLPGKRELNRQMRELDRQFLMPLASEKNGPEQMEKYFRQLSKEAKELLEVHLPQLPEEVVKLLRKHSEQLPREVKELLAESFPWLLEEDVSWPEYEDKIKELLKKNIRERPVWGDNVLLQKPPRKVPRKKKDKPQEEDDPKGERRDFGAELWLNDAGYEMGRISDTGYYLWLSEYLAARGSYYKDNSIRDAHVWLYRLLISGLGMEPEQFRKNGKNICGKAEVETYLKELAEKIREPQEAEKTKLTEAMQKQREIEKKEIAGRLHGLYRKRNLKSRTDGPEKEDYLLWLTERLKRMSVHIRLKNWLQDNGYPLAKEGKVKTLSQKCRQQNFPLRLFETFCDSADGYEFSRKKIGLQAGEDWKVSDGFCVWEPDNFEVHLQTLLDVLKRNDRREFYFPLALDLRSGCVFFLAGKEYYKYVYDKCGDKKLKKKYEAANPLFCYDYLRLAGKESFEDDRVTFELYPAFHENAGKEYDEIFKAFKAYCKGEGVEQWKTLTVEDGEAECYVEDVDDIPREKIRALNDSGPIGIPKVFRWAFDGLEMPKPSRKAKNDHKQTEKKINKERFHFR